MRAVFAAAWKLSKAYLRSARPSNDNQDKLPPSFDKLNFGIRRVWTSADSDESTVLVPGPPPEEATVELEWCAVYRASRGMSGPPGRFASVTVLDFRMGCKS